MTPSDLQSCIAILFTGRSFLFLCARYGGSAYVQAGTKAEKLLALLKVVAREIGSTLTMGIYDLAVLLKSFFAKMIEAAAKGFEELYQFFKRLINGAFGVAEKDAAEVNRGKYAAEHILGYAPATKEELAAWKVKILALSEKTDIRLLTSTSKSTKYFKERPTLAAIYYKEGASNYVIAHEYYHAEEFAKIGKDDF